ncbi:MAG: hypothetical protein IPN01_02165 [Deltaproteobacteria bacterium]|nr:hypothetical protein [Deltaproteobacteria bacterium]
MISTLFLALLLGCGGDAPAPTAPTASAPTAAAKAPRTYAPSASAAPPPLKRSPLGIST